MKLSSGSLLLAMTCFIGSGAAALAGSTSPLDPYASVEAPKRTKAPKSSKSKVVEPVDEPVAKTYVTMPAMPPDDKIAHSKSKRSKKETQETVVSEKGESSHEGGLMQKCVKGAGAGMAAPFKGMAKGAKAAGNGTKKLGEAVGDGFKSAGGFFAKSGKSIGESTAAAAGSAGGAIGGAFKASKEKLAGIPNPLHHEKRSEAPGAPSLKNPSTPAGMTDAQAKAPKAKAPKVAHASRFHMPKIGWPHRQPEVPPVGVADHSNLQ